MGEFIAFPIDSVFTWESGANGETRNWRSMKMPRKGLRGRDKEELLLPELFPC